jgi:hypothetical protein
MPLAARTLVAEGIIHPEDIELRYKGQPLEMNEYGRIANWPDGFAECSERFCECILTAALKIKQNKRGIGN